MTTYRITWVDAEGFAACLGLDETLTTDSTAEEVRQDALHHGAEAGADLDRYDVAVNAIE